VTALRFVRVLRWTTVLLRNVSEACIHTLMQIEGDIEGEFVAKQHASAAGKPTVETPVPESEEALGEFDDHPPGDSDFLDANDD